MLEATPILTVRELGLDITVDTSDTDGTVVVLIDTYPDHELTGENAQGPKIRIHLNDSPVYANPKLGETT